MKEAQGTNKSYELMVDNCLLYQPFAESMNYYRILALSSIPFYGIINRMERETGDLGIILRHTLGWLFTTDIQFAILF